MSNVIDFESKLHPAGGMALHASYGFVDVVEAEGMQRKIVYQHFDAVGVDPNTQDVLYAEEIRHIEKWVSVSELKEANLEKDIKNLKL